MSEIVFVVDSYAWQYVRIAQKFVVSEKQLQCAIDSLHTSINPLSVDAIELRDYLDGRGELAVRVELSNQTSVIRRLLENIAPLVALGDAKSEIVSVSAQDFNELERVKYVQAFVRSAGP